jgi:hypothetical protein
MEAAGSEIMSRLRMEIGKQKLKKSEVSYTQKKHRHGSMFHGS